MRSEVLEELVLGHQAEIYRYVRFLGATSATAEDVVQDSFLAAFRSPNPLDLANVRLRTAWLRGIARNTFLKHCRRGRRRAVVLGEEALNSAEACWAAEFVPHDDGFGYLEALRQCLDECPENHRKVLEMRYFNRESRSRMSELLEMTEEGVKKALQRIRDALRHCVEGRLTGETA